MPGAPPKPWDVPLPVVLGALAVAASVLLPLAHRVPAYPVSLPPLATEPAPLRAEHREDLARPRPAAMREIVEAWDALTAAQSRRDGRAVHTAQARFASVLFDGTENLPELRNAARAVAAQAFLDGLRDPRRPGTVVAARHGLAGPSAPSDVDDAQRLAWFIVRWERLALPTPSHGHIEPLVDTLLRVSPAVQRGFAAWVLGARCPSLLGTAYPADPRPCADELRRPMIAVASRFDPSYPRDEALAATDMMLAVALRHPSDAVLRARADTSGEGRTDLEDAQAALHRAQDRYAMLHRAHPSRRWERLSLGALQELTE